MDQYQAYLLQEMGISTWQLNSTPIDEPLACEPEAQPATATPLNLADYDIVIIADACTPTDDFVVAVLKSIQLKPQRAKVMSMAEFVAYQGPMPSWIWSTAGEISAPDCKFLHSPSIAKTSQDPTAKRVLWQQIKSHLSGEQHG